MHRYTRWLIGAGAILAVLLTVALAPRGDGEPDVTPSPGHATTPPEPTPPVDASGPDVRITAAGDIGSSAEAVAVLRLIDSLAPDANIALGDLSYGAPGTESEWCDLVRSIVGPDLPFQLLAGNHESDGLNGDIRNFAACLPNMLPGLVGTYAEQWYVDLPAEAPVVRLVMISPGMDFADGPRAYGPGAPDWIWTRNAVRGAHSSGIPWVVVGAHAPCLSLGAYDCRMTPEVMNMLVRVGADLVLSGHEHIYQRTAQLGLGSACAEVVPNEFDPACVADSDTDLVGGEGAVFVTAGTGGTSLRTVNLEDPEVDYFEAWNATTWGVVDLHITRETLDLRFVPAEGGSFRDQVTIRAPSGGLVDAPTAN